MNERVEKWMAGLRDAPEFHAEGLAMDLMFSCEAQREKLGLSYSELARRMGVSRQYINKVMNGTQNSTLGTLVKLAFALGCTLELKLTVPPQPKPEAKRRVAAHAAPRRKPDAASQRKATAKSARARKPARKVAAKGPARPHRRVADS